MDSIDSVESEDSTDSIDSIDFIDSIDSILVPHKRPPTFTPHTKGKTTVPMGAAPKAPPPSVLLLRERSERPLCVWCPESALGSLSTLYTDNMFVYYTDIYTQYMYV